MEPDSTYADRVHDTDEAYMAEGLNEDEAYERALAEEPLRSEP